MYDHAVHCTNCEAWDACAFKNLAAAQLDALFHSKNCLKFEKHQTVFAAKSKPLGIYCIKNGMVKLTNQGSQEGIEQILHIAKGGEIVGVDDILSDHFYHYSVKTLEESEICLIDKDTFIRLMTENLQLAQEVLRRAFVSIKDRDSIISRLTRYNVRERTALTLLSLIAEHGVRTKAGIKLDVQLTRREIGQYTGTVQESIIRILADFKKEGFIHLHKSEIIILNQEALAQVASPLLASDSTPE